MTSVFRITLDIHQTQSPVSIPATQGADNVRLIIRLTEKGNPFDIEDGSYAIFSAVKPDGNPLYNDCAIYRNSTIVYDFTPQTTAVDGITKCQIHLYDTYGRKLHSPRFQIVVHPDIYGNEIESTMEYKALAAFVGIKNDIEQDITNNASAIAALKEKITTAGTVTIPASEWTDTLPKLAFPEQPVLAKGTVALLMPGDTASQNAARKAKITVQSATYGDGKIVIQREDGEAPTGNITLDYIIIKVDNPEAPPKAALIGVDAYEGGGTASGVDEEAVRAIITAMLGNVDNERQYSAANPPPYPVTSVNDQMGAVSLSIPSEAADVGADPAGTAERKTTALREEVNGKLADYDKSTAVNNKIYTHNTSTESHADLRVELQRLSDRLNAALNSTDTSLDDLKEIVAYIKSNKTLIDGITSSKVSITDIVDNLVTNVSNQPLSAAQGVILKQLIDELETELASYIKTADIVNGLTSTDTDKPLSAMQGMELKKLIDLLDAGKLTSDEANDLITNALKLYTPTDKLPSALPTPHKLIINGVEFNGSETIQLDLDELPIVTSTADMTDRSQLYVLESSAHIWRYREVKGSKNWLKEVGYKYGVRVDNKNGAEITNDASITGYIPCSPGQKVTIRDLVFDDGNTGYGSIVPVFDKDKNIFSKKHLKYFSGNQGDIKKADNGDYYFTMPAVATTTSEDGSITAVAPVVYFRAQFSLTTTNPDNGNIAVGEEMTDYETGYHWVDTGIAYTWGNDTALLALEDRVTANENKIEEIQAKIASSLSVPDYWQDHIAAKIAEIQSAQAAARQRCVTWATVTDIHDDSNAGGTGRLIKAVCDPCGINAVLFLGDYSTRATKATADRCRQSMGNSNNILAPVADRLLGVRGNHDGGYKTSDAYLIKPSEVDSIIQYPMATGLEITYDAVGSGYYATDRAHKVRYIMLNTDHRGANPDSTVASDGSSAYPYMSFYRYTQVQMEMVKEALTTIPNDSWTVIVASHVPPIGSVDRYGDGSFVVDLSIRLEDYLAMRKLLNAYVNRTAATVSFSGSATWDKINMTVDFSAAKGHLAEYQSGHLHRYLFFGADHVDPKSNTALGFPIRSLRSDGFNENFDSTNGSELDDAYANQRVLGTTTEHSFVVCVHNIDTRETTCIHVGAQEE